MIFTSHCFDLRMNFTVTIEHSAHRSGVFTSMCLNTVSSSHWAKSIKFQLKNASSSDDPQFTFCDFLYFRRPIYSLFINQSIIHPKYMQTRILSFVKNDSFNLWIDFVGRYSHGRWPDEYFFANEKKTAFEGIRMRTYGMGQTQWMAGRS